MDVNYEQAQPTDRPMIIGIAGPNGSGKTASALRLAVGITRLTGGDIYYIDTENKRALAYSSLQPDPPRSFAFKHFDFKPPFTAERYQEAVQATDKLAKPGSVIIIDSMSHEHEGMGGLLERSEEYLDRVAGTDQKYREKLLMASIIKPKMERTRLIQNGLQRANSTIILCFRAKDKIKPIKAKYIDKNGVEKEKMEIVNRGIQIIGGEEYGFEVSVMFILPVGAKGKPDWKAESSRINDMKGDLIRELQAIPQMNEEMGEKIKNFFSAIVPEFSIEELKGNAKVHAVAGTESLKQWWVSLGGAKQKAIGGAAFLEELKRVAEIAERARSAGSDLPSAENSANADRSPV